MAIDDVLASSVRDGLPVLRWYSWSEPEIAIGYFQSVAAEVDIAACERDGIAIFRRMSGGGAVYKDPEGEINYTIILPITEELAHVRSSYRVICEPIITALNDLGIAVEFSGINDLVVDGKKISGNAQTRIHGVVLQHGTILVDFHPELMARYLRFSNEKLSDKQISSMSERVTTLMRIAPTITSRHVMDAITAEFERSFSIGFERSTLTAEERSAAHTLSENHYATHAWNRWR